MNDEVLEQCWSIYISDLRELDELTSEQERTVRLVFLMGASAALSAVLQIEMSVDIISGVQPGSTERSNRLQQLVNALRDKIRALGMEQK